jgi:hypothetical protein
MSGGTGLALTLPPEFGQLPMADANMGPPLVFVVPMAGPYVHPTLVIVPTGKTGANLPVAGQIGASTGR